MLASVSASVGTGVGQKAPPVGPNLYVAADIGRVRFEDICRRAVPLLGVALMALLCITYVPWFSLALIGK